MKASKKIISIILAAVIIIAAFLGFASCGRKNKGSSEEETTTETTTEAPVIIEDPNVLTVPDMSVGDEDEFTDITDETTEKNTEQNNTTKKYVVSPTAGRQTATTKKTTTTKKNVTTKQQVPSTSKKTTTTKKAEPTTKKTEPTTKKTEPTTKKTEPTTKKTEPITVVDIDLDDKYSCGVKNHHCSSEADHQFICSLEQKGCPICGSHSCPSFYAVDEWGNSCYDMTECPEYSSHNNHTDYCEHCGKPIGLGDNGTCVRFTVDTVCPICGETVKAKTCHTH